MRIVYIYRVVRQQLSIPGTGCYTTFGIAALQLLAGHWQKVRFIADVSLNQQLVETLAAACTTESYLYKLTYDLLADVVEDAIV